MGKSLNALRFDEDGSVKSNGVLWAPDLAGNKLVWKTTLAGRSTLGDYFL